MSQSVTRAFLSRVLLIAAIIGAALLIKPALVIPTFKSPTALLIISLMIGSYLALSNFILPRLIKKVWIREGILWVLLVAGAVLLILPYFRNVKAEQPAPPGIKKLASNPLRGIDHRATGDAVLYQLPSGGWAVRLENIDLQSGPDYDLYLIKGANQEKPQLGGQPPTGVNLGDLAGNQGNLHFVVPDTLQAEGPFTALIWCEFFSVPVANATFTLP
jgi:hypothetical protein